MKNIDLLIICCCLSVTAYLIETLLISAFKKKSVSYLNLIITVIIISCMCYFIYNNYHPHVSLLNIIIWCLVAKNTKKTINIKRLEDVVKI